MVREKSPPLVHNIDYLCFQDVRQESPLAQTAINRPLEGDEEQDSLASKLTLFLDAEAPDFPMQVASFHAYSLGGL
jgi:hypothetical protein